MTLPACCSGGKPVQRLHRFTCTSHVSSLSKPAHGAGPCVSFGFHPLLWPPTLPSHGHGA
eukprot:9165084-Pyramimonas_sp.AAC.1